MQIMHYFLLNAGSEKKQTQKRFRVEEPAGLLTFFYDVWCCVTMPKHWCNTVSMVALIPWFALRRVGGVGGIGLYCRVVCVMYMVAF